MTLPAIKQFEHRGAILTQAPATISKQDLIERIAKQTLSEWAAAIVFSGITCTFVISPVGQLALLTTTAAILLFNTAVRGIGAFCTNQLQKKENIDRPLLKTIEKIARWICPYNFATIDQATRDVIIHEGGHALAAKALYQNPRPVITVEPFRGGATNYFPDKLSRLGNFFGSRRCDLIVSGAGASLSLLFSLFNIGVAHKVRDSHPELKRYLLCVAVASIVQHAFYALSALVATAEDAAKGHDFAVLAAGGIHPLASAVSIIALPLLFKAGLCLLDHLQKN